MLGFVSMKRALLFLGVLSFLSMAVAGCGTAPADAVTGDAATEGPSPDGGSGDGGSSQGTGGNDATTMGGRDAAVTDASAPVYDGTFPDVATWTPPDGGACGYMDAGTVLHVGASIELCMPKTACNAETCPPDLADCVNDECVYKAGYRGVSTLAESWVTYYCQLSSGGCRGVTQLEYPEVTAQQIASARGIPLCDQTDGGSEECMGIAASSAMVVGNSQEAIDSQSGKQVVDWGQGLTEASGLCYELTGAGGTVLVALTDRCGGYCQCNGSAFQECGPCVNATDMVVNCPCVGTAPPAYTSCCGATCGGTVNPQCDWCASNSHPHFDLDIGTFNRICASQAVLGSCQLTSVRFVPCLTPSGWPPN